MTNGKRDLEFGSVMPFSMRVGSASGSAVVTEHVLVGHIAFNLPMLIVGTILAVILAAIGLYVLILGDARVGGAPIDDAGLLSLMALDNSSVASRLVGLKFGTSSARRRAGAFMVEIVDGRLAPVGDVGEDDLDEKSMTL
ncbi:unnamed protein product [Peniophora sp. CBMAI 1063]|nr:unnamed protein product [Peniophora sp. CBMAI 1063]